jgi:hypothetical protein
MSAMLVVQTERFMKACGVEELAIIGRTMRLFLAENHQPENAQRIERSGSL